MYTVALIPPNPDCSTEAIRVSGYRKSHVEKFIEIYFEDWEWQVPKDDTVYSKAIRLNSRGKPTKPIVSVKGGVAYYKQDQVTVLDFDTYEGM